MLPSKVRVARDSIGIRWKRSQLCAAPLLVLQLSSARKLNFVVIPINRTKCVERFCNCTGAACGQPTDSLSARASVESSGIHMRINSTLSVILKIVFRHTGTTLGKFLRCIVKKQILER